ncbi:MAG: His/Gly/Thr/Pro-type tRNA ligase C-terminal domain-containing protein, partial [Ignavibacteria bacterium]|nr:His/Gly/Thr/Pro-type tRNA ligase C-terminal domain-containing protein [Ignavibacteria bacterium]
TKNNIEFEISPNLVRGLDYYTKTAFEFTAANLGAQDAICGGGRYDLLVSQLGGKDTPAVGWACGMERLILAAGAEVSSNVPTLDCFICILKNDIKEAVFQLVTQLRNLNISCEIDLLDRSLKAQMREANRQNAKYVLIIGENEFTNKKAVCKDLATGEQFELEWNEIENFLTTKLNK